MKGHSEDRVSGGAVKGTVLPHCSRSPGVSLRRQNASLGEVLRLKGWVACLNPWEAPAPLWPSAPLLQSPQGPAQGTKDPALLLPGTTGGSIFSLGGYCFHPVQAPGSARLPPIASLCPKYPSLTWNQDRALRVTRAGS